MSAKIQQEMRDLIAQGLTGQNLRALRRLAESQFDEAPTIYGSLNIVLASLVDEYDALDAVPPERFQQVNAAMSPVLIAVLDAFNSGSAPQILDSLNKLYLASRALS